MTKIHGGDIYSLGKKVIDFSSNINPLGINDEIISALKKGIYNIKFYPDVECGELRNVISQKESIDKKYIICGNGAAELIYNIVLAIMPKKALFTAPSFFEYERAVNIIQGEKKYYFLKYENDFDIFENILDYIDNSIDMVFICNPNNPTGRCVKKVIILKVIEKCEKNSIFAVIDECFMDFVDNREKYSALEYLDEYRNFMILKSFTKVYAIPGLRLGYALCSDCDIIEKMYLSRQPWSVSSFAQKAGIAAFENRDFVKKTVDFISNEREYIIKQFERLKIKYINSKANYILFKSEINLDEKLLKYGILIRNCDNYIGLGKGYYRIAVKRHNENKLLIKAIEEVYGSGNVDYDTRNNV